MVYKNYEKPQEAQMEANPPHNESKDSLEDAPFSTEGKVDQLIQIAADVKAALNKRSLYIALGIIIPLFVGAIMLWQMNMQVSRNQRIVSTTLVNSLEGDRDFLQFKKLYAETRDCPIEYFRALVLASRQGQDIMAIEPPCEQIDLVAIDAEIARLEREIARRRPS